MEITPNYNGNPVNRVNGKNARPAKESSGGTNDSASIGSIESSKHILQSLNEVRPEVVATGKELAASVSYPPPEIVKRIAELLALES